MLEKTKAPIPDFIRDMPVLDAQGEWFNISFWELSSGRTYAGMGGEPMPIDWKDIRDYCNEYGVTDVITFRNVIRLIDDWFIHKDVKSDGPSGTSPDSKSQGEKTTQTV